MYKKLLRPLLFRLSPETAHRLAVKGGQTFCTVPVLGKSLRCRYETEWPSLNQSLMGINFPNPLGMAAGFDKNARYAELLRFMGFGYAEFGSITAQPSSGNPRPRLFRIPEEDALINRMGLNNDGAVTICQRLLDAIQGNPGEFRHFIPSINIAKTHDPAITGDEAIEDYLISFREASRVASYITLNISCPNTAEGKTFEEPAPLKELLDACRNLDLPRHPPVLVKFSPDLETKCLDRLIQVCEDRYMAGYVCSNTSSDRSSLRCPEWKLEKTGPGGLSGAPLYPRTLERIRYLRKMLPADRVLIACGGIHSPWQAAELLRNGADLLQLYTGLIFEGPDLPAAICRHIEELVIQGGFSGLGNWLQEQHKIHRRM